MEGGITIYRLRLPNDHVDTIDFPKQPPIDLKYFLAIPWCNNNNNDLEPTALLGKIRWEPVTGLGPSQVRYVHFPHTNFSTMRVAYSVSESAKNMIEG